MDTFMDKLAQKLTAQEMIKANSAADAEEMERLRTQIREYREILDRMQQLVDDSANKLQNSAKMLEDGAVKIENARVDGGEINRLVDESIAKIEQLQQNTESLEELKSISVNLNENLKSDLKSELRAGLAGLRVSLEENQASFEESKAGIEATRASFEASKAGIEQSKRGIEELKAVTEGIQTSIGDKFTEFDENMHRECVRVYRNVQAVMIDENKKQTENLEYPFKEIKGKLGAIMKVAVALIISIVAAGGTIFQLLTFFGII